MSILGQLLNVAWMATLVVLVHTTTRKWPLKPTSTFDKLYVISMIVLAGAWIVLPLIDLARDRDAVVVDFAAMTLGVIMADWCLHAWRTMVSR